MHNISDLCTYWYNYVPNTCMNSNATVLLSVRHNPCEHSRINILQWILTKLGTYLVLKRIWNPIDFQGQRSRSPSKCFTV